MEPRQHEVAGKSEQASIQGGVAEYVSSPEHTVERRGETAPELGAVQAEISQITMPTLPMPAMTPAVSSPTAQPQANDTPLVANDDDLIEKEWVEKAKRIIAETREDPYRREQEINKLQIEYIRKRYGRVIGETSD